MGFVRFFGVFCFRIFRVLGFLCCFAVFFSFCSGGSVEVGLYIWGEV